MRRPGVAIPLEFYFTLNGEPIIGGAANVSLLGVSIEGVDLGALSSPADYSVITEISATRAPGWYMTTLSAGRVAAGKLRAYAQYSSGADLKIDYVEYDIGYDPADVVAIAGVPDKAVTLASALNDSQGLVNANMMAIRYDDIQALAWYYSLAGLLDLNITSASGNSITTQTYNLPGVPLVGCLMGVWDPSNLILYQQRLITAVSGPQNNVFTLDRDWETPPAAPLRVRVYPAHDVKIDNNLQGAADVQAISSDSSAADNLEAILDGTGGVALVAKSLTLDNPDNTPALAITSATGRAVEITSQGNAGVFINAGSGDAIGATASGGAALNLQSIDSNGLQVSGVNSGVYASGNVALTLEGSSGPGVQIQGGPDQAGVYVAGGDSATGRGAPAVLITGGMGQDEDINLRGQAAYLYGGAVIDGDGNGALDLVATTGNRTAVSISGDKGVDIHGVTREALALGSADGVGAKITSTNSGGIEVLASGTGVKVTSNQDRGLDVAGASGLSAARFVRGAGADYDVEATISGAGGGATPVEIRQEMDSNSVQLARLDVDVSTRLAASDYTAPIVPDNAAIAAIKLQTDKMQFVGSDIKSTLDGEIVSVDTENFPMDLDAIVEGDYTLRDLVRLVVSHLFGKASGGGTSTLRFRDLDDTKDRLVITVGRKGDRTAVSYDPS